MFWSKSDLSIFALLLFVYIFIMFNPHESLGVSESELHVISSMLCTIPPKEEVFATIGTGTAYHSGVPKFTHGL